MQKQRSVGNPEMKHVAHKTNVLCYCGPFQTSHMTERSNPCTEVCVSDPVRVFYLFLWVIRDTYEMLSIFCFVPLYFMRHSTGTESMFCTGFWGRLCLGVGLGN